MRLGRIKGPSTEVPLEVVFTAKTDQEAETLAKQWLFANVPHDWPREFVDSAQSMLQTPTHGKKAAPNEWIVTLKISPPRDADDVLIARVRKAISEHRSAHS